MTIRPKDRKDKEITECPRRIEPAGQERECFDQGRAAAYQINLPQLNPTACLGAAVGRPAGPEVPTFSQNATTNGIHRQRWMAGAPPAPRLPATTL